jgi:hypothetical protein
MRLVLDANRLFAALIKDSTELMDVLGMMKR